ncbi:DUF1223 domain-containing protein [Aestuariivirga sp.]|uniref:DUF1223 domain-containing protein n=1 Tax=Aestuariivirga sp. TaxID=2650926 RepID=UPI0039E45E2E
MRPSLAAAENSVVVELFTSQGCSSCPPADAFLGELAKQPHVVALSYHVDYWDYLGWKDTLGKPEFSQRQYDYAHARGDMDVYTPQMIVNGSDHLVGSDRAKAAGAIESAAKSGHIMPLTLSEKDMELIVDIGAGSSKGETTLWVLPVVAEETVKILKGEIAGQDISYVNIVRAAIPAGMWNGEAKTVALPKESVMVDGSTGCVALLQQGKVGPIVGLGQWGHIAG